MAKNDSFEEIANGLAKWAKKRDLLGKDPHIQFSKIVEELGETSAAYNKQKHDDLVDSIGDLLVTIIILASKLKWILWLALTKLGGPLSIAKVRLSTVCL